MKMDIEILRSLLATQKEVNNVVAKKLDTKPTLQQYILAYNVELYEFINTIGIWKWWKHSHKVDRARVLDELADCYAFMLSAVLTKPEEIKRDEEVVKPREDLLKVIKEIYDYFLENAPETQEERIKEAKDGILLLGTSSDLQEKIDSVKSFAIANYIAFLVLENLTFEEVVAAYKQKSEENINRQKNNY